MNPLPVILRDRILGQLMFLVLFILAAFFYLERTIFVDPCYAVFNVLYYRDYVSEAGRYAAVYPQTLILLAVKFGLSLRMVLLCYSLSFMLLYYIVYLVISYGFRLSRLALAVPLVLVTGVQYSFFWISTETHQAVVYTILLYAYLTWSFGFKPGWILRILRLSVAGGIMLLCFFSHPVALFLVLFVLGFFILHRKLWLVPEGYLLAGLIVALGIYKFMTSSPGGYETIYFKGFGEFFDRIGYVFHSESLKFIGKNIHTIYLFSLVLFLITTVWYIRSREYLKLALYLGSLILIMLILFTTFDIWYYPFIQEKNLMGISIFLLIPFLTDVLPGSTGQRKWQQILFALIFLAGTAYIVKASFLYHDRLEYIGGLVKQVRQLPGKKFILPETMVDRERLNVYWALAPETLILSSLEGPNSSVSVYINDSYGKLKPELDLQNPGLFICAPWAQDLEIRRLDSAYFNLNNSTYRILVEGDLRQGEERVIFSRTFSDNTGLAKSDSCATDSTGNRYLVMKEEFSHGLYGTFSGLIKEKSARISATVRVMPLEKVEPKWINLVISRENEGVVLDYFRSGTDSVPEFVTGRWTTLRVSGLVTTRVAGEQLKVYIWNPSKKKIAMDDLVVTSQVTGQ